jgi:hypothetical protein
MYKKNIKILLLLTLISCGNYIRTNVNTNVYVNINPNINIQTALDMKLNLLMDLQNASLNANVTPQIDAVKTLDKIIAAKCAGVQSAECSNYLDTITNAPTAK